MLGVFSHTPTAATVVGSRRDGSVIHLIMRVTPPSAELTWFGDDS